MYDVIFFEVGGGPKFAFPWWHYDIGGVVVLFPKDNSCLAPTSKIVLQKNKKPKTSSQNSQLLLLFFSLLFYYSLTHFVTTRTMKVVDFFSKKTKKCFFFPVCSFWFCLFRVHAKILSTWEKKREKGLSFFFVGN